MAERSNAHDSKSCYAGMYTRVQIPFSAPQKRIYHQVYPFLFCIERLAGILELIKGSREELCVGNFKKLCELFVKRIDIAVLCAIMKWKK